LLHPRRLVNDCRTVFDAEFDPVTVCRFGSACLDAASHAV
jgi:hypothetical protein